MLTTQERSRARSTKLVAWLATRSVRLENVGRTYILMCVVVISDAQFIYLAFVPCAIALLNYSGSVMTVCKGRRISDARFVCLELVPCGVSFPDYSYRFVTVHKRACP